MRSLLRLAALSFAIAAAAVAFASGMDADPEAQALRQRLEALAKAGVALDDDYYADRERRITGPITLTTEGEGRAARFPEGRIDAQHIYYGVVLPRRGLLSLDFRVDALPQDHNFMTLCSPGTPGNTKFWVRFNLDRTVVVQTLTRREAITLQSDPLVLGEWHHLEWYYAPEGSLLILDGVIHDYSTDYATPYTVEVGEAMYVGDQPWWDPGAHKGVFYPADSFVGLLDNLKLMNLKPE